MNECLENEARYTIDEYTVPDEVRAIAKQIQQYFSDCFCKQGGIQGFPICNKGSIVRTLRQLNTNNKLVTITDTQTNKIASFLFLQIDPQTNTIFIHTVCTNKDYYRRGCCKRLISHITNGYNRYNLRLGVRVGKVLGEGLDGNPACYCYEKYGFRISKVVPTEIKSDGLNVSMIRPVNGIFTETQYENDTLNCSQALSNGTPRPFLVVGTYQNKDIYLIKNNTPHIPIGQIGSNIDCFEKNILQDGTSTYNYNNYVIIGVPK